MKPNGLGHIGSILKRVLPRIRTMISNGGGASGFGRPGAHAARSPFPLAWEEGDEKRLDKAPSKIR